MVLGAVKVVKIIISKTMMFIGKVIIVLFQLIDSLSEVRMCVNGEIAQ